MCFERFIHTGFAVSMFCNALFFIPQIVRLIKTKKSDEISLPMFVGFAIGQIFTIWHAYFVKDYVLMRGFLLSFFTCGTATALIIIYRLYPGGLKNKKVR